MGVIGQLRAPAALTQVKIPGTRLVLDWVAILIDTDAVRLSKNLFYHKSNHDRSVVRPVE